MTVCVLLKALISSAALFSLSFCQADSLFYCPRSRSVSSVSLLSPLSSVLKRTLPRTQNENERAFTNLERNSLALQPFKCAAESGCCCQELCIVNLFANEGPVP